MTEIGMALTNPLAESERRAGCVGVPFPGVEARIAAPGGLEHSVELIRSPSRCFLCFLGGQEILCVSSNLDKSSAGQSGGDREGEIAGDLQIRGKNVFREYYNKPAETAKEFTEDGWFKTGDSASMDPATGVFKIRGRTSVDIIK